MSCCWPQGDPKLPGFSFCGQPVARPGLPYCGDHMRRAHPARDPARRPGPAQKLAWARPSARVAEASEGEPRAAGRVSF
jgi:hypothetical protein